MRTLLGLTIGFLLLVAGCYPSPEIFTPVPTSISIAATSTRASAPPAQTPTPLPWYQSLDPSYAELNYQYAHVTDPQARLYLSAQGALQASLNSKRLPQADAYVAYVQKVTEGGQVLYHLASGEWMRGQDLQEVAPSTFSGVLLTGPVGGRFGWVLEAVQSLDAAGNPVRAYTRYQVVREGSAAASRAGFLAVGPDEWLPLEKLSLITPGYRPPTDVNACRFVVVDLAQQNLSVYAGCQLVFATLISSGRQFGWTPTGTFTVFRKTEDSLVTSPFQGGDQYYLQGVPYISYFYSFWAFHGAYWHDRFGFPASHGCINLSPADAHWLFNWIAVGDRVIVLPHG
jgi:L,D-transpeptidase catalytic domain